MALSPDGTTIVYQGIRDGRSQLFRRRLSEGTSTPIDGTAQHFGPFFSPDGQWLGFHNGTVLKKMPAAGGQAVTIAQLPSIAGASWGEDGFIVVGTMQETGLFRVPSAGGSPELLTAPTAEDAGNDHRWPQVLPGGRGVLFSVSTGPEDTARIVVLDARTGARKDLVTGSASARYVATGHLAYTRDGMLFVQPFDLGRLELTGSATRLADGVDEASNGEPEYAFSDAGALVYGPGWSGGNRDRLALVDLAGQSTLTSFPAGAAAFPRFSPDGRFIALWVGGAKNNVWIYDVTREASTQATFGRYHLPSWSPAGQLTMSKGPPDHLQIVRRDAFGDLDEPLTDVGVPRFHGSWTPDGRTLFFDRQGRDTGWDVFKITVGSPVEQPVIVARGDQQYARVSPDGRWLVYVSNEGGRNEVFLRALDGPSERRQVSVNGGVYAAWSPDGRRIYFRQGGAAGTQRPLWAVDVTTTPTLSVGRPVMLFNANAYARGFDVSPDGRRFAMIERAADAGTSADTARAACAATDGLGQPVTPTSRRSSGESPIWSGDVAPGCPGQSHRRARRSSGARRSSNRRSMPRGGPNSQRRRSVPARRPLPRRSLRSASAAPASSADNSRRRRTARRVGSTTSSSASCTVRARLSSGVSLKRWRRRAAAASTA